MYVSFESIHESSRNATHHIIYRPLQFGKVNISSVGRGGRGGRVYCMISFSSVVLCLFIVVVVVNKPRKTAHGRGTQRTDRCLHI